MIDQVTASLNEDDFELFRSLHAESISPLYPFSSAQTAESFINQHKRQIDATGYFTIRKTMWKAISNNSTIAFTVVTEKRGGSIKFGPTIVVPRFRNQGVGSQFRTIIEEKYSEIGYRKAYSTTSIKNLSAIYYVVRIGYRIEVHLKDHYEIGKDELVLGKSLKPKKELYSKNKGRNTLTNLEKHMFDNLSSYCNNIDKTFFENVRNSLVEAPQKNEQFFIKKGRKLFNSEDESAIALTVPKRGGCVKVFPLVLCGVKSKDETLISSIVSFYQNSFHKLYTFSPLYPSYLDFLRNIGFVPEGLISEPYKSGVDLIVMSFFI